MLAPLKDAWDALDRDDFRLAEARAREAIARDAQDAEALYLLGSTFLFEGRLPEALAPLTAAAARLQRRGVGYRLGHCQFGLGDLAGAEASLRREAQAYPQSADAQNTLGSVLSAQGRHAEALEAFQAALRVNPAHVEALVNAGTALHTLGRHAEALPLLERAAAAQPGFAHAHLNLGLVQHALQRYEEAAASVGRALAIDPDLPYGLSSQVWAELFACDWRAIGPHIAALRAQAREQRVPVSPFMLLAVTDSPAEQLQATQVYLRDKDFGERPPLSRPMRTRAPRIRIAYLSSDFHQHATAQLMTRLFELHDRSAFEVIGLSTGVNDGSPMRARLERAFDRFIDVERASDAQAARQIADLGVDIAIDLKGHTEGSRMNILGWRPAPVQVTYLGYPATVGAPYIDYVLADRVVIPPEQQRFYTERVVWLPDSYQVNDDRIVVPPAPQSRAAHGLPAQGFVFCAFNNAYKLRPETFALWLRLLRGVPGSVLWLLANNPAMERRLREQAGAAGIAPERLVFAPKLPLGEHLARHACADLFLDTLPVNAHTTASDALRAGVPMVTCMGHTFAGRVAASLLLALGLPELVTDSLGDYEALALKLALQPQALAEVRAKLARNRATSSLFDTARTCRRIEAAYRIMWERHLRGEPPAAFAVEPAATS
ncbi:tetratricopeptide repeat protein [Ramlibacter ginsenosidimutans]|uniref:protein O-GlcNAc transferase n=1 Tax=Ramlibacter ginsenosidimutans TaxID=502333 RepID=A0A934TUZ8_9BURK|nr:tetratricopeptide repeat protein [Ramlibacter ginsenosidimutans]MBK6007916.1 tetratricopeptide repeat protein [Ramlibacter ginsenosidimutans]